jgi:parafibromin
MIDQNASRSCLEGCLVHNSEATTQSDNLDREILSHFLVRRNFGAQASETASTSDRNSNAPNDATPVTSHRKHLIRHHSSERSPRSPNTAKSGESRKIKGRKGDSKGSSRSASSRYPNITSWSAGIRTTSPSSFGPPQHNPADPPRPPKSGHEWVWFPEGYWAEREIRGFMPPNHDSKQKWWDRSSAQGSHKSLASQRSQKSQSPRKLANEDTNTDDNKPPLSFIPQIKIGSISLKSTRKTSRQTSQHASDESRKNSSFWRLNFHKPLRTNVRQSSQEREGLYRWTKRTLETRLRKRVRTQSF